MRSPGGRGKPSVASAARSCLSVAPGLPRGGGGQGCEPTCTSDACRAPPWMTHRKVLIIWGQFLLSHVSISFHALTTACATGQWPPANMTHSRYRQCGGCPRHFRSGGPAAVSSPQSRPSALSHRCWAVGLDRASLQARCTQLIFARTFASRYLDFEGTEVVLEVYGLDRGPAQGTPHPGLTPLVTHSTTINSASPYRDGCTSVFI